MSLKGEWFITEWESGLSNIFKALSNTFQLSLCLFWHWTIYNTLEKPVNIYVSVYIRFRPWEPRSNSAFICDLPLTCLTEAAGQAFGNQMSGWVLTAGWGCTQPHMWVVRPMHVHLVAFVADWPQVLLWGERLHVLGPLNIFVHWSFLK